MSFLRYWLWYRPRCFVRFWWYYRILNRPPPTPAEIMAMTIEKRADLIAKNVMENNKLLSLLPKDRSHV